jgi:hypothetical protein
MKKFLSLFLMAMVATFIACGPSAKEKAEKARQDSIRVADSIAQIELKAKQTADSIAMVQKAQHIKDSLKQDSIAKAAEKKAPKKVAKKVEPKKSPAKSGKVGAK